MDYAFIYTNTTMYTNTTGVVSFEHFDSCVGITTLDLVTKFAVLPILFRTLLVLFTCVNESSWCSISVTFTHIDPNQCPMGVYKTFS